MKALIAIAALVCVMSAHADPTPAATYKVVCAMNTYSADGSNFQNVMASDFTLTLDQKTEVYRSATAVYSVVASESKGSSTYQTLFLEVKDLKTGTVLSAAEGEWQEGSAGDHRLTTYATDAEPNLTSMLFCQNAN